MQCGCSTDFKDEEDSRWNDPIMRSPIPPFAPQCPISLPLGKEFSSCQERPVLSLKTSHHDFANLHACAKGLLTEAKMQQRNGFDDCFGQKDTLFSESNGTCEFCASLKPFLRSLQASQERIERTLQSIGDRAGGAAYGKSQTDASTSSQSKKTNGVRLQLDSMDPSYSFESNFSPNHSPSKSGESPAKRPSPTKAAALDILKNASPELIRQKTALPKRDTVFTDFTDRIKKYRKLRASVEMRNPTQDKEVSEFLKSPQCSRIPVFSPYGMFVNIVWAPVFFVAILWALCMSPFDMAFHWWEAPGAYKATGKLVDIFFILDLILHFNIAITHDGHIVSDRKKIAVHYAKTWLFIDIIANTPYDWFISGEGKSRKFLKIAKLPKLLRAIRLFRSIKKSARYIGVGVSCAGTLLSAHWFACLWVGVLQGDCDDDDGSDSGCPDIPNTYVEALSIAMASFSGADSWTRLLWPSSSSYLSTGRHSWESFEIYQEVVAITSTIAGLYLTAVIFYNVSKCFRTSEAARQRANLLEDRRKEMKQKKVPSDLRVKVELTYRYLGRFANEKNDMLKDKNLSLDLRRNLAFHMYGEFLKAVPMFTPFDHRILKSLSEKIVLHLYSPGDLLIQKGEVGTELFIIHSGSAQPITEDGLPLTSEILTDRAFFGEICFLSPGSRRKASVVCVEICRAMILTLSVFKELNLEDALTEIRSQANYHLTLAALQRLA